MSDESDPLDGAPDHPKVLVRPPFLFLATIALGVVLDLISGLDWSYWLFGLVLTPIAFFCIVIGVLFMAVAIAQFARAQTNVRTDHPAHKLVTGGIYRLSRNPIYVGMILITIGVSFAVDSPIMLVVLAFAILILRFGVIAREEKYLTAKYGEAYAEYKARVGRWFWTF